MKVINHYDATSVNDAVAMLDKYGAKAAVIGAGTDLLYQMKEFTLATFPDYIINLKTIPNLANIKSDSSGLHIGPNATLAAVSSNSTVVSTWPMLASAAGNVATPNIRNVGTIGGNLCQEVWCWYYRWQGNLFNCLRKGGSTCYATAGDNTFHSIFGGPKGCYSVHPSDTAPALLALGASVTTNKRTLPLSQFFYADSPGHVLAADEVLTSIDVPNPPSGNKQVFIKQRLRQGFDFALVDVALLAAPATGTVTTASIWLNGVAPTPIEATAAETALKGNTISATLATTVGNAAATNAVPMSMNAFRVQMLKATVAKAVTS